MRKRFSTRGHTPLMRPIWALLLITGVLALAAPASAQSTAVFQGAVMDDTGGVLPGITVTLTGDALIGGPTLVVTGGDGTYRLGQLPPGLYTLTFELPGFSTIVRDELRLTTGFTAEIDVTMVVGALEESITVSGESPVVDIQSTATSIALTREIIENVPRGRGLMDAYMMTPGVITSGAPQVGDSNFVSRRDIQNYGVKGQPKLQIEGINISTGPDENSGVYVSQMAFEEIEMKASGNDAEVMVNGLAMVGIIKSGGNQFHGSAAYGFQRPGFQANNITPELSAQGIQDSAPLRKYYETSADLGGRIIRDKLWFYVGADKQVKVDNRFGFRESTGPDGSYRTGDDIFADYNAGLDTLTMKLTGQITPANKMTFLYQTGDKTQPQNQGGSRVPLETTRDYRDETWVYKMGFLSVPNSRLVLEVNGGSAGYFANYSAERGGTDFPGHTSRFDADTRFQTGAWQRSDQRPRSREQLDGSITFLPRGTFGGTHELKTGVTLYWENHSTGVLDSPSGNFRLQYDGCSGAGILPDMSNCAPQRLVAYNHPVAPTNLSRTQGFFIKDTWRMNDRLTLNLGVRYDRQRSFLKEQTFAGSTEWPTIFPAATFSGIEVQQWNRVLPRVGGAYDLTGDGKTLLKGTFGVFGYVVGDSFAGRYNVNSAATAQFQWTDQDGNNEYTPGEVDLDLNGPDFISISAAANRAVNPDLKQPIIYETTMGVERELMPGLGLRVMYVYKSRQDFFDNSSGEVNVLRPYASYNIPITRRDPGPDGVLDTGDDGGSITFFDYDPALRGSANVLSVRQNNPFAETYQTIELTVTKRASARWSAVGSFWHTWTDQTLDDNVQSPNDEFFLFDQTTSWSATGSFVYNFPFDITGALNLQSRSGVYGQRTVRFSRTDPDGGPSINQLGNVTLRVEPYGDRRSGVMNVVSIRGSKRVRMGGGTQAAINLDVFGLFNSSVPTDTDYLSGGAFGEVQNILAPRIARVSFDFRF